MILLCIGITMHALKIATTSTKSSAVLKVQVWDDTRAPKDLSKKASRKCSKRLGKNLETGRRGR
jgi:hypothetical protein